MIKNVTVNTQEINISYLQDCLEKRFSHSIYTMTRNGNVILLSYKKPSKPWCQITLEVKQPVIFIYDEDSNLLAYGTPEDQEDFESNFAKACYKILNELQ
ncbi:hypothetical protein [Lactobacillus phage Lbab1]|nr:hypothetical protein [Lactobacillus phage Lbab1]